MKENLNGKSFCNQVMMMVLTAILFCHEQQCGQGPRIKKVSLLAYGRYERLMFALILIISPVSQSDRLATFDGDEQIVSSLPDSGHAVKIVKGEDAG